MVSRSTFRNLMSIFLASSLVSPLPAQALPSIQARATIRVFYKVRIKMLNNYEDDRHSIFIWNSGLCSDRLQNKVTQPFICMCSFSTHFTNRYKKTPSPIAWSGYILTHFLTRVCHLKFPAAFSYWNQLFNFDLKAIKESGYVYKNFCCTYVHF